MSDLPWNRWPAETPVPQPIPEPEPQPPPPGPKPLPVPVPEQPQYETPVNLPEKSTGTIDFGQILKDAFKEALQESAPQFKETATDYVKGAVGATVRGDDVDWAHPTVTAVTSRGKELVVADARNRSWRTFLQGMAIDITFAVVALLTALTSDFDPAQKGAWIVLAALVIKTIIQTAIAYIMRLRVTPTITEKGDKLALVPVPEPVAEKVRNYQ